MGLDIFFLEDIRKALLAANEASSSTSRVCAVVEDPVILRAYRAGFQAALTTIALAFGLNSTCWRAEEKEKGGQENAEDVYIIPHRIRESDT
jgi:hypothetical protein